MVHNYELLPSRKLRDAEMLPNIQPETFPLWQRFNEKYGYIPTEIIFPTGSIRKRDLVREQLRAFAGNQLSEFFQEKLTGENVLPGWHEYKQQVPNANQSTSGKELLGYLGVVPVVACSNTGEKNAPGLTSLDEARNKALAAHQEHGKENVLYLAADTMDVYSRFQNPTRKDGKQIGWRRVSRRALGKPSSMYARLQAEGYPEDERTFKKEYIEQWMQNSSQVVGMTAMVLFSSQLEIIGYQHAVMSAKITTQKLLSDLDHFDMNAAGAGAIQQFLDWEAVRDGKFQFSELLRRYVGKDEAEKYYTFFALCQVSGISVPAIVSLIEGYVQGAEAVMPAELPKREIDFSARRDVWLAGKRKRAMLAA